MNVSAPSPEPTVYDIAIQCTLGVLPSDGKIIATLAGIPNYTAGATYWISTGGGWQSNFKSYGIRTISWKGAINNAAGDTFYFGENDGGNRYWQIRKATIDNRIRFETDNNTGVAQVTDNIVIDPTFDSHTFKVQVDNGITNLYVDDVLLASHATKPCPINVVQTTYWYALGAFILRMYNFYFVLGYIL